MSPTVILIGRFYPWIPDQVWNDEADIWNDVPDIWNDVPDIWNDVPDVWNDVHYAWCKSVKLIMFVFMLRLN